MHVGIQVERDRAYQTGYCVCAAGQTVAAHLDRLDEMVMSRYGTVMVTEALTARFQ